MISHRLVKKSIPCASAFKVRVITTMLRKTVSADGLRNELVGPWDRYTGIIHHKNHHEIIGI